MHTTQSQHLSASEPAPSPTAAPEIAAPPAVLPEGHAQLVEPKPTAPTAPSAIGGLTANELGEVLGAFDQASRRLQSAHEALRAEVARLERELREANEQLERSRRLAALGQMAAGIAHEVRNPLGSIRLYARMLEDDLADRPPERDLAVKIGGAVRGLDAVVGDVLAFAREIRVQPEQHEAAVLLDHACEEALASWRAESPASAMMPLTIVRPSASASASPTLASSLRASTRTPTQTTVLADAALLHRALVNLIRNALQAMAEAPPPAPHAHTLTLACTERIVVERDGSRRPMVALLIQDTGPGIAPEALERLFQPFYTTRAAGTGLGLAIVHRIVDAHDGRIFVRNVGNRPTELGGNRPPRGAIFEVTLPARSAVFADYEPNARPVAVA